MIGIPNGIDLQDWCTKVAVQTAADIRNDPVWEHDPEPWNEWTIFEIIESLELGLSRSFGMEVTSEFDLGDPRRLQDIPVDLVSVLDEARRAYSTADVIPWPSRAGQRAFRPRLTLTTA